MSYHWISKQQISSFLTIANNPPHKVNEMVSVGDTVISLLTPVPCTISSTRSFSKLLPRVPKSSMRSSSLGDILGKLLPEVPKSSLRSPMGGILCQEYTILGFLATFVSQWPKLCITYSLSHTMCVETNNASSYSSEMLVSTFQDSALTYRDFPTIYRLSHCAHSS